MNTNTTEEGIKDKWGTPCQCNDCERIRNTPHQPDQTSDTSEVTQTSDWREKPDFGDKVSIEMKRYGFPNEFYNHKVVSHFKSNTWVDVPVQSPAKETIHNYSDDVVLCICEGVDETEVLKYRWQDVKVIYSVQQEIFSQEQRHQREVEKRVAKLGEPLSTYIQWKGTDVCMDWYCENGHHNHIDGYNYYEVVCEFCQKEYKLGDSVSLYQISQSIK